MTHLLTNAPLQGPNCIVVHLPPSKGALQCTSQHSRVCWSPGSEIIIVPGISTWPVPSRRVHRCHTSNPSVHPPPMNLETCLAYY